MIKKFFTFLILTGCILQGLPGETAHRGSLNITDEVLEKKGYTSLEGEWEFYWHEFILPGRQGQNKSLLKVPGNWASGGEFSPSGYATYRLHIRGLKADEIYSLYIPEMISAHRFFVNGKELASNGQTGRTKDESVPSFIPATADFIARPGVNTITIWVSNFNYRKSGVWRDIYLGLPSAVHLMRQNRLLLDMFLIGLLLFVSIYHISIFLFRREENAQLYFGLICLVMGMRILSTGEQLLSYTLPSIPWWFIRRMEFSHFPLATALTPLFIQSLFPMETSKKIIRIILSACVLSAIVFFLFPVGISNYFVVPGQILIFTVMTYCLAVIIQAIKKERIGSHLILWALLILFISILNDVLYSNQFIRSFYMAPIGFILFIIIQALMLARRNAYSFRTIENLTLNLREFNESLSRFVPFQFLNFLQKKSILEVNLGDQVHEDMTILFADIRSFTSLSEDMTPEENFRFLNSFLSNVVPVIREEGGFVDKFIGDGIMALFPDSPVHALKAAVGMQEAVKDYNKARDRAGYRNIRLGIGLHTGGIMLGTIGEHDRMETTVISDTVNIASRMEVQTKTFGASIIISLKMYEKLKNLSDFDIRYLGPVTVKGKRDKMEVLEVLNGLDSQEHERKTAGKEVFETAVKDYLKGDTVRALAGFHRVLSDNPEDGGAAYYIKLCTDLRDS